MISSDYYVILKTIIQIELSQSLSQRKLGTQKMTV